MVQGIFSHPRSNRRPACNRGEQNSLLWCGIVELLEPGGTGRRHATPKRATNEMNQRESFEFTRCVFSFFASSAPWPSRLFAISDVATKNGDSSPLIWRRRSWGSSQLSTLSNNPLQAWGVATGVPCGVCRGKPSRGPGSHFHIKHA